MHLSPSSLTLPPGNPLDHPESLEDHDTDCDHLANAGNDGQAIKPASPAIRRRAVLEKGLRPFFHGGWVSALCIGESLIPPPRAELSAELVSAHPAASVLILTFTDMKWEDPRTETELEWARQAAAGANFEGNLGEVDVSYTVSGDGVEIKFENPLEVLEWKDDPRLRDFEETFFALGGQVNGKGF